MKFKVNSDNVHEPTDIDTILLHNEASDSNRINELKFQVMKLDLKTNEMPLEEFQTELEVEEFKLEPGNKVSLQLNFGNFE